MTVGERAGESTSRNASEVLKSLVTRIECGESLGGDETSTNDEATGVSSH